MRNDLMFRLGQYRFYPADNALVSPQNETVHLRKQALMVLHLLAENAGQVVEKKDIFNSVWGDVHVSDDSLTQCIREIRRALGPNGHEIVRTAHGRGFRLVAEADAPAHRKLKPMIAVFPFSIIGDERTGTQVRDLIADDLTQTLSRSEALEVISALSARRFALSDTWSNDFRTSTGVDYVLRGSLARRSDNVILRMELIDVETLQVVWSDVSDHRLDDLVHDIASLINVTSNVHRAVLGAEIKKARGRRIPDLQGHTIFTNALDYMYQSERAKFQKARELLEGLSVRLQPEPDVLAANALWNFMKAMRSPSENNSELIINGQNLAEHALSMDANCINALSISGSIRLLLDGDVRAVRSFFERALNFNPNAYKERLLLGAIDVYDGHVEQGLESVQAALRLVANHPYFAHYMYIASGAFIVAGQLERATEAIRNSLATHPRYAPAIRLEIIAEHLRGNNKAARFSAQRLLEIEPGSTVNHWRKMSMASRFPIADVFSDALREAGIPE